MISMDGCSKSSCFVWSSSSDLVKTRLLPKPVTIRFVLPRYCHVQSEDGPRNDPSWAPLADDHISRKTIAAATATYSQEECSFMQATSFFANVRHHSCTYFTSFQGEFVFRLDHTTLGISERKRNPLPFDGKLCACRGPIFYLVFNALTLLHRINELVRFGNGDAVLHGLHNRTIFPR